MKNQIEDLRNHLFAQLERLGDDEMNNKESLEKEIKRAKAISEVSMTLIHAAKAETDFVVAAREFQITQGTGFMPLTRDNPPKSITDGR